MKEEVRSATDFLARLVSGGRWESSTTDSFREELDNVLFSHYEDHWFPEKPFKGSAYRCMRIVNRKMDPLISKAGSLCGLTESDLLRVLPSELTMWIDPTEVSYRIGEDGSIGVLYDNESVITGASAFDYSSSPASSTSSSPCPHDNLSSSSSSGGEDSMSSMMMSSAAADHNLVQAQSCKDQVRSVYFPNTAQETLNFDRYLAQFVAS